MKKRRFEKNAQSIISMSTDYLINDYDEKLYIDVLQMHVNQMNDKLKKEDKNDNNKGGR